jgi:4'-phosphopantetheinyl transferase
MSPPSREPRLRPLPMPRPLVHVLHVRIDLRDEAFAREAELRLPAPARERARSYRRPEDRCRFLAARLLLRAALRGHRAAGAGDPLDEIRADAHGRPALPGGPDFNLSHSGTVVACAVAAGCRVGIDVERIRPLDLEAFATRFSPAEWRLVRGAASPPATFLRYWTMKESVLKADGRGLSVPLREVRISGREGLLEGRRWTLFELRFGPGYAAHLAAGREDAEPVVREVPPDLLLRDPDPAPAAPEGALPARRSTPK